MRIEIDLSLFDSPTTAWGYVDGEVDLQSVPSVGDRVDIADGSESTLALGLPRDLRVLEVEQVARPAGDVWRVSLEPVVLADRAHADALVKILEDDFGLFCVPYHEQ